MTTPTSREIDLVRLVRPAVSSSPAYLPSQITVEQPPREIRLDMNESPHGPSPKTREAIEAFISTHRYPDFAQKELRAALAEYTGMPADQIVTGAGMDDVFVTVFMTLVDPGDEIVISDPTFGMYRGLAQLHGGKIVNAPLTADFELDADAVLAAITPKTKMVIICTPNNPTANVLDDGAIEKILQGAPCLVLIDEAYAEFAGVNHIPWMKRYPNLAVGRTMSKFAGLAGMRVGYGVFPAPLMPYLNAAAPAFHNVSAASAAAAIAALQDLDEIGKVRDTIVADREALAANLREIPGVEPLESGTNFLLVRLPMENAEPVVQELAKRGIHLRYFSSPAYGLVNYIRVTVGSTEENEIFLHELADILANGAGQ